jgi:integrase
MATTKLGIYRAWRGPIPIESSGQAPPKSQWPSKRPFSWVVRWFGFDGNRYSRSFRNRKDAERFAETKQQQVRQGKSDEPKLMTFEQFYKEHAQLMKGNVAPKPRHAQLATMTLLAKQLGWDRRLDRITARDIEHFRSRRLEENKISPYTSNKELKTLKRVFNLAVVRGYLPTGANPCIKIAMIKVGRKRPPFCCPEDFQKILQRSPTLLMQTLLVMFYTSGLRLREALNLTWSDIEFDSGQLHVARKKAIGFVQDWTPKDHELRVVPMPKQAIDLLATCQTTAPLECPYVFMDGGRWAYYREEVEHGRWNGGCDLINNILRRFKTICRQAGVGPFTIHDLRRSCISNWARHLPIHVVQQLAGHSDIKTTQQFYLSVRSEDIQKAQRVQQKLIGTVVAVAATDQKVTNSAQKREFPKRKVFCPLPEVS